MKLSLRSLKNSSVGYFTSKTFFYKTYNIPLMNPTPRVNIKHSANKILLQVQLGLEAKKFKLVSII